MLHGSNILSETQSVCRNKWFGNDTSHVNVIMHVILQDCDFQTIPLTKSQ